MEQIAERPSGTVPETAAGGGTAGLADSLQRLLHVLTRARSQLLDRAQHDVEWSAQVLMNTLVARGPMRTGALADAVQADASTVSRQVAQLVRDGFVQRRADQVDGRVCVVAATQKAERVVAEHKKIRDRHYERMLAAWSEQDCDRLARLVTRFTVDFEAYKHTLAAEGGWAAASAADREEPVS